MKCCSMNYRSMNRRGTISNYFRLGDRPLEFLCPNNILRASKACNEALDVNRLRKCDAENKYDTASQFIAIIDVSV